MTILISLLHIKERILIHGFFVELEKRVLKCLKLTEYMVRSEAGPNWEAEVHSDRQSISPSKRLRYYNYAINFVS